MRAMNMPRPGRHRRSGDPFDLHQLQSQAYPADIDQGVDAANFMKVHLLRRLAVNSPFRFSQQAKNASCALLDTLRQHGVMHNFQQIRQMPMRPVRMSVRMPVASVMMVMTMRMAVSMTMPGITVVTKRVIVWLILSVMRMAVVRMRRMMVRMIAERLRRVRLMQRIISGIILHQHLQSLYPGAQNRLHPQTPSRDVQPV